MDHFAKPDDELVVYRGLELDDDVLRSEVITGLMGHFSLRIADIEQQFAIDFGQYFAQEMKELHTMAEESLLMLTDTEIIIVPAAHLQILNVCRVFDKYLRQSSQPHSKVI